MGQFFNKIRQVFNIFLIMLLITAVCALFIYFMTTPEQRDIKFWTSIIFLALALIIETLQASGIAMRSNNGKNIPVSFTKFILGAVYFIVVIALSIWNAFSPFTETKYILIHVLALAVFLIPMALINMAELRLSGSDRKQQAKGRINLASLADKVKFIAQDMKSSGITSQQFTQIMNLSESIRYSDPTPASGKLENALESAVENLSNSKDINEILNLCVLAERALIERNNYVKNSK